MTLPKKNSGRIKPNFQVFEEEEAKKVRRALTTTIYSYFANDTKNERYCGITVYLVIRAFLFSFLSNLHHFVSVRKTINGRNFQIRRVITYQRHEDRSHKIHGTKRMHVACANICFVHLE